MNDDDDSDRNALKGGALLRFVDGWSDRDRNPIPPATKFLVQEIDTILQRWKDGTATVIYRDPVTGKLPDLEELNREIPVSEWELDLNGQPRKPEKTFCVYLLDIGPSGQKHAFVSSTAGASMGYRDIKNAMETKKLLHGVDLLPIVLLRSKMWKPKKFAARLRPYFDPVDWIRPGGGGGIPAPAPVKQISGPAEPLPPARDIIDDSIPF
jgi:hypothetical protein